MQLMIKN